MVDNKDKKEEIKAPEKRASILEQAARFEQERTNIPEKKEISPEDRIVADELRREIEILELNPDTKKEAEREREKIEFLGEKEKIEHLLQMAREKGVVFAIHIANKMGDPYIVDTLHDILAREGLYKKLGKVADDDNDDNKKT